MLAAKRPVECHRHELQQPQYAFADASGGKQ
jgi:hypothetical protein